LEIVKVYYRWHPLFGLALPVKRREKHRNGERVLCQAPDGRLHSLPGWMCDPECLQFSLGSALICVEALSELRALLDLWHTSSKSLPDKEEIGETIDCTTSTDRATESADEPVASAHTTDNCGVWRAAKGTDARASGTPHPRSSWRSRNADKRRRQ
jgi:hypothetical protein